MDIAVTTAKSKNPKTKTIFLAFAAVFMVGVVLNFVSFLSNVNTTIQYDYRWVGAYVLVLLVMLVSMAVFSLGNKAVIDTKGGIIKKLGAVLASLFATCVLAAFAVFSGVPTVLHYLDNAEGQVDVTVQKKETNYVKGKCRPRLIIKEFTFFTKDHVCPGERAFNQTAVGARIRLIGRVSSYGIEPAKIQW